MQRSWALAKSSWAVLKSEKGLVWLPVLSFIVSVDRRGRLRLAVWATLGKDTGLNGNEEYSANVVTYVLGFCTYIGVAFVADLLPRRALRRRERAAAGSGHDPRHGARRRAVAPAPDPAVGACSPPPCPSIIQAIEERFGILGRIIASLIGAAWNVVTFLTVPIIVFEDLGPIAALKRPGTC